MPTLTGIVQKVNTLTCLHDMLRNFFTLRVKMKFGRESLTFQQVWHPMNVIHPHILVRNIGKGKLCRPHLFRLNRLALPRINAVYECLLIPIRIVGEIKIDRAKMREILFSDLNAAFLLYLANNCFFGRLTRQKLASIPIPFALAKAALLHTKDKRIFSK